ncbi:MAG: SDR family oxidoreductase [Planctomycetota bacterium]|nr:SDR family oxidoreductase [Planctomycetota bacterium]
MLEEHTPLKRIGTTEDVTGAGLFLASEASRYVTGITLLVDGGLALNRVWNIRPT